MAMSQMSISVEEFVARRERVLEGLGGAVGVVFAGEGGAQLHGKFKAEAMFRWLTGIADEPGAAVLFDPESEDPRRRCVLFLKPRDPDMERWDGARDEITSALKTRLGFASVMRTSSLPRLLTDAVRRRKRAACLHSFATYEGPVSPDLAVFRKVGERIPGVAIEDRSQLLHRLRGVKSEGELAMMRRAIEATAAGFAAAMRAIRPGVNEGDVQRALEAGFRAHGGTGTAYNSIVGSGFNGTVLHYGANDAEAQDGELMVIDAGAEYGPFGSAYASDVTRTFPVSGRFTAEQRGLYELVLRAQEAAIAAVRPGVRLIEVDAAARKVIEEAGYGDAFIHSIGHHLGLDVHDVTPDGALEPGMVVTIEPGIYLPERRIGIRIEDDVLVTKSGRESLTATIPKTVEEVERVMGR